MSFQGMECPVCHQIFEDSDDIVVCPECGTPHHRECWNQLGHCVNSEKHGENFSFPRPQNDENEIQANPVRNNRKTRRCPDCGHENEPESTRCSVCGRSLRRPEERFQQSANFDSSKLNTDFVPPNVIVDGIPAVESAAFIGSGCTRYITRFIQMERNESKLSWNWAAAIFGPLWCFYRKLYKTGFLYLFISLIITIVTLPRGYGEFLLSIFHQASTINSPNEIYDFIMNNMPVAAGWQQILSSLFRGASMVLFGLFGDYFYKRKVKSSVLSCRTKANNMRDYLSLLRIRGGISPLMVVVYLFVLVEIQNMIAAGISLLLT